MNIGTGQDKPGTLKKGWMLAALLMAAVTLSCSMAARVLPNQQDASSNAPGGLIAYVGADGNIYTIARDGKQKNAITKDANPNPASGQSGQIYQYPTWSPDGRRLAYMSFTSSPSQSSVQASLFTVLSNGKAPVQAFTSQDYTPFYLYWSPNSQYVTFLSSDPSGVTLTLQMAAAAGGDTRVLGVGQPFYWDWSPDNQAIIVHTGGAITDNPDARMTLYELGSSIQKKELDIRPSAFQAPDWSPDGSEMALAAQDPTGAGQIILAGRDGSLKRVLAHINGPVAFAWSPDGKKLAAMVPAGDPTGPLQQLILIDPAQPDNPKEIVSGLVVAFIWSPDHQKIAYFILTQNNPGLASFKLNQSSNKVYLEAHVIDLSSGVNSLLATFTPTDAFVQILTFFDQYQRSGTIWSPDSQYLVLSALSDQGSPEVIVANAQVGQPVKIADGDLAFWSWK